VIHGLQGERNVACKKKIIERARQRRAPGSSVEGSGLNLRLRRPERGTVVVKRLGGERTHKRCGERQATYKGADLERRRKAVDMKRGRWGRGAPTAWCLDPAA